MSKVFRRPLSLLLLLFILPMSAHGDEIAGPFSDVTSESSYFHALTYLKEKGIIGGYPDGSFKPESTINRAEAMKLVILGRSVFLKEEFVPTRSEPIETVVQPDTENPQLTTEEETSFAEAKPVFSDVHSTQWFYDYVYTAYDTGVIQGYEDGTFQPANEINKAETLKIILRTFNNPEGGFVASAQNPFPDVPFSSWYAPYVTYAKEKFFIEPEVDGNFNGASMITRGEFADILYRQLYSLEQNLTQFDPSVNWDTFNRSIEGYMMKVPPEWERIEEPVEDDDPSGNNNTVNTVFWRQDNANGQDNYVREYPNSASVKVIATTAPVEKNAFFSEIRNAFGTHALVIETTTRDMPTLVVEGKNGTENILDAHIYMPDGSVISLYGTFGNGPLAYENTYLLKKIRENFAYTPRSVIDDTNKADILTIARSKIQVDGEGQATLDLFDDLDIIETDTIGVGTGPVDYYFSAKANVTLKYERHFDVILDIEEGKTSKF